MRPDWARNMTRIGVGVYVDDQQALHVDPRAIAASIRIPFNEETEKMIHEVAREAVKKVFGVEVPITVVDDHEGEATKRRTPIAIQ